MTGKFLLGFLVLFGGQPLRLTAPAQTIFEEVDDLEDVTPDMRRAQGRGPRYVPPVANAPSITEVRPRWFGNGIGVTDEVLPPWTPIGLEGDRATVVLRAYHLGPSGLPASITSRGLPLLAAAASLTLDGVAATWNRQLASQADGRVVWDAEGRWPTVRARLRTTLEYDGLLRYDLTLAPAADGVLLRNLELHLPYRAERAQFGANVQWTDFGPYFQIADMETGLAWFCEWAKGWQIGAAPCLETPADGEQVNWRIRFIGHEGQALEAPLELTFGLQALPVRELDLSYQYDKRRVQNPPSLNTNLCTLAELADNALVYANVEVGALERGTLSFHCAPTLDGGPVLDLGPGRGLLAAVRSTATKYRNEFWHMTARGDRQALARLGPLTRAQGWFPLGLTWERVGPEVRLIWHSRHATGEPVSATNTMAWSDWSGSVTNGLRFGGDRTLAVDEIALYGRVLTPEELTAVWDQPLTPGPDAILLDPLERVRFSRGGYLTRPLVAPGNRGGRAEARYSGVFVERLADGRRGAALLLPAGENPDAYDWLKAYGGSLVYGRHETMNSVSGFYGAEFVADPIWRREVGKLEAAGLGLVTYGGFGFHRQYDPDILPFLVELVREPHRGVKRNTALLTCAAAPGTSDYYLHCWKQGVEYYNIRSIHADNTIHAWTCFNERHGCGWRDAQGELQGRTPIFAARDLAKRFRWLFHVYRPDGFIQLHAGARGLAPVGGFADLHLGGEKMGWTGQAEDLPPPETWNSYQHRLGVPVEILTKGRKHAFGPNWLYMYTLLSGMSVRMMGGHLNPAWWWTDLPEADTQKPRLRMDRYQPYAVRGGVSEIAHPGALWWLLQDDFNTREATFHPFWRADGLIRLNPAALRAALYTHPGQAALVILSNFGADECAVNAALNWNQLGLASHAVQAWDAYTDEPYAIVQGRLQLTLPAASYRIVRIEIP
ncbi:MAG: DUF6067 family protein [Candidatus Marinimicrobia bacterium]|nr:DUF6067 family protein [Candidatus Neomarinimicrobiota bacterium]